jgi:hypothetical protein
MLLLLLGCCCCSTPSPGVETSSQKTERQEPNILLPYLDDVAIIIKVKKTRRRVGLEYRHMAPGYQTHTGYKEDTIGVICVITQCQIHNKV